MIGLVICLLLNRHADAGLIAAFAAIGVGFGGQETYGQTVGLSLLPETFWWAILGFVDQGNGVGTPLAAPSSASRSNVSATPPRSSSPASRLMVFGTWLGWQFLNNPKLIYFSNRLDRPREELWAGLWLGGLLLLAWLRSRVPSMFALYGAIGGGIGFGVGASLQPMGRVVWAADAARLVEGHGADVRRSPRTRLRPVRVASAQSAGRHRTNGDACPPPRSRARFSQPSSRSGSPSWRVSMCLPASTTPSPEPCSRAVVLFSGLLAWQTAITATCRGLRV